MIIENSQKSSMALRGGILGKTLVLMLLSRFVFENKTYLHIWYLPVFLLNFRFYNPEIKYSLPYTKHFMQPDKVMGGRYVKEAL